MAQPDTADYYNGGAIYPVNRPGSGYSPNDPAAEAAAATPPYYDPTPPPRWYPYTQSPRYVGAHTSQAAHQPEPPPDPWAGIPGAIHDGSNALVDTFVRGLGSEQMVQDANTIAIRLAKAYPYLLTQPSYAYEQLFNWAISDDQRLRNPWLRFGMKADDYYTTVGKLNAMYSEWTGDWLGNGLQGSEIIHNVDHPLWQAIRGGWLPNEVKNFAMYGNPQGGGELRAEAKYAGSNPWLGQGQSYNQTMQQFAQFEGYQPPSKEVLADFWRFGSTLKNLGQSHVQESTSKLGFLEKKVGEVR